MYVCNVVWPSLGRCFFFLRFLIAPSCCCPLSRPFCQFVLNPLCLFLPLADPFCLLLLPLLVLFASDGCCLLVFLCVRAAGHCIGILVLGCLHPPSFFFLSFLFLSGISSRCLVLGRRLCLRLAASFLFFFLSACCAVCLCRGGPRGVFLRGGYVVLALSMSSLSACCLVADRCLRACKACCFLSASLSSCFLSGHGSWLHA